MAPAFFLSVKFYWDIAAPIVQVFRYSLWLLSHTTEAVWPRKSNYFPYGIFKKKICCLGKEQTGKEMKSFLFSEYIS